MPFTLNQKKEVVTTMATDGRLVCMAVALYQRLQEARIAAAHRRRKRLQSVMALLYQQEVTTALQSPLCISLTKHIRFDGRLIVLTPVSYMCTAINMQVAA